MKTTMVFGMMCLASGSWLGAQSVVAADGGTAAGAGMTLEWTLGETSISSGKSQAIFLTEGFHQPILLVEAVSSTAFEREGTTDAKKEVSRETAFSVTLLPNPVASILYVRFSDGNFDGARLELADASGQVLIVDALPAESREVEMDLANLSSGIYFLRCRSLDGQFSKTFKVTKF
jgi:hypothetical protein